MRCPVKNILQCVSVLEDGIISLILFMIIYLNDLVQCTNNFPFIFYAGDSNIFFSDASVQNCIITYKYK